MNQLNSIVNLKLFLWIYFTVKKKFICANHAPCMAKRLRKPIMKRSELKSKYIKIETQESLKAYKKQRHFCSRLYKKEQKKYNNSIDFKNINNKKWFWKTAKPFLSGQGSQCSQINIVDH